MKTLNWTEDELQTLIRLVHLAHNPHLFWGEVTEQLNKFHGNARTRGACKKCMRRVRLTEGVKQDRPKYVGSGFHSYTKLPYWYLNISHCTELSPKEKLLLLEVCRRLGGLGGYSAHEVGAISGLKWPRTYIYRNCLITMSYLIEEYILDDPSPYWFLRMRWREVLFHLKILNIAMREGRTV